jgi:transcriptional regulator with XRE-family HTH domain
LIGVSGEQISNYETGAMRIAAARLYQVSIILQLPINAFFEDVPGNPGPGHPVGAPQEKPSGISANLPKYSSEAEVIAKLGRLASRVPDPVLRASVQEILRELPVFRPSVEPEETGGQDEGTACDEDSLRALAPQAQESLAPSKDKKRNLLDHGREPRHKRSRKGG